MPWFLDYANGPSSAIASKISDEIETESKACKKMNEKLAFDEGW